MKIESRIPYLIAREVLPAGRECDELARLVRRSIDGYLNPLVKIAKATVRQRRDYERDKFRQEIMKQFPNHDPMCGIGIGQLCDCDGNEFADIE